MGDLTRNPIIKRDAPDAVVYDLSEPHQVTITLPTGSTWTSGLHWHRHHVEYLRVLQGSIRVTLDNQACETLSALDPTPQVRIDRNVWHEWGRAEAAGGEDVVVQERTAPADGGKAVFFWNLNGVILRAQRLRQAPCPPYMPRLLHGALLDLWVSLNLFAIFRCLDNIPVFLNIPQAFATRGFVFADKTLGHGILRRADLFISQLILTLAGGIAFIFGISAVRDEFTPDEVRRTWIAARDKQRRQKVA